MNQQLLIESLTHDTTGAAELRLGQLRRAGLSAAQLSAAADRMRARQAREARWPRRYGARLRHRRTATPPRTVHPRTALDVAGDALAQFTAAVELSDLAPDEVVELFTPGELDETAHRMRVMELEPVYEAGTRFVVPETDSVWGRPIFPQWAGRTGVVMRVLGPVIVPPTMVENVHLVAFDDPTHPTPGPAPRRDGYVTLSHTWMAPLPAHASGDRPGIAVAPIPGTWETSSTEAPSVSVVDRRDDDTQLSALLRFRIRLRHNDPDLMRKAAQWLGLGGDAREAGRG